VLLIPASALILGAEGTQVVVIQSHETVHYQKKEIGRDYGTEVEVISGLAGDESLIVNPTDAL